MRLDRGSNGSTRSSALWGKPSKGESRSSALWGKGGRGLVSTFVVLLALAAPVAATADSRSSGRGDASVRAYLSPGLLQAAQKYPKAKFDVIVQGSRGKRSKDTAEEVGDAVDSNPGTGVGMRRRFSSINGVAAQLTGRQILHLANRSGILSITSDAKVALAGSLSNRQRWPYVTRVHNLWKSSALAKSSKKKPTIAIVDSGIDAGRADFDMGARVIGQQVMTQLLPNSPGDGRGHGTFVAGIAAGSAADYAGAAPQANILSIDVMDDNGMAMTRDVIAAADWIYANRKALNIRVANFSLHSSVANSFMFDPLNQAVEKLWFGGVVVVAAAGNYGQNGQPSGVTFAPGNDPFVITVGAVDVDGSISTNDDYAAPWSAYGYTLDGFAKPDISAPGRYIVGPVPAGATLPLERPGNVLSPGYMQLSGTSFAAPMVAGGAAQLVAAHPGWTPDQVKGALMLTARPAGAAAPMSAGVGVADIARANAVVRPPNPNLGLNRFVVSDSHCSCKAFNAASWANVARSNASWANASWASASWASASWSSASWASASWASASWASASWASDSLASASWAAASWADNAEGDLSSAGEWADPAELAELGVLP